MRAIKCHNVLLESALLAAGFALLLLTLSPSVSGDGVARYRVVEALLAGERPPATKYSFIQPILSLPLAYAADAFGISPKHGVAYFNLALLSAFSILVLIALRNQIPFIWGIRFLLLLLCASMLPYHLQQYYGEVFSSVLIVSGVLLRLKYLWLSIILMALGVTNTPVLVVPLLLSGAILQIMEQKWEVLLGSILGGVIVVVESYLKFGLDLPYFGPGEKGFATALPYSGLPGFSYPLFFGVMSVLFSFGKGILFYIPALTLFFSARVRSFLRLDNATGVALAAFVVATVLIYAKWWAWYGGNFWGPRFFLILCFPATLALVATIQMTEKTRGLTLWAIAALILSTWVALDGYVFAQSHMDLCWQNNYALESLCWYVPEFSALWRPVVTHEVWHLFAKSRGYFAVWQVVVSSYFVALCLLPMLAARRIAPDPS